VGLGAGGAIYLDVCAGNYSSIVDFFVFWKTGGFFTAKGAKSAKKRILNSLRSYLGVLGG
jgi:hypothetical protein